LYEEIDMHCHQNRLFRPSLEALERRLCLTTLIRVEDNFLYIDGDDTVNQAEIFISGRETSVAVDGGPAQPIEQVICWIVIGVAGGNDRVSIDIRGSDTVLQSVQADLGDGNDVFSAVLIAPPEPDVPGESNPPEPELVFDISMGFGDDQVMARVMAWNAATHFNADLGDGNDSFEAVFQIPPEPEVPGEAQPPDPDTPVFLDILAGIGHDDVRVTFFDILGDVHTRADLGEGNDSYLGRIDIVDLSRGTPAIAQLDPGNFVGMDVLGRQGGPAGRRPASARHRQSDRAGAAPPELGRRRAARWRNRPRHVRCVHRQSQ
jgi:hypothetical protein